MLLDGSSIRKDNPGMAKPPRPEPVCEVIANDAARATIDESPATGRDPAAVALGRKGGLKGGAARAMTLNAQQRWEITKKAAGSRWAKNKND